MLDRTIPFQKILKSSEVSDTKKILIDLVERLEHRIDPKPDEMLLLSEIYQLIEKFSKIDNIVSNITTNDNKFSRGNKLSELWDNKIDWRM